MLEIISNASQKALQTGLIYMLTVTRLRTFSFSLLGLTSRTPPPTVTDTSEHIRFYFSIFFHFFSFWFRAV